MKTSVKIDGPVVPKPAIFMFHAIKDTPGVYKPILSPDSRIVIVGNKKGDISRLFINIWGGGEMEALDDSWERLWERDRFVKVTDEVITFTIDLTK